MLKEQKRPELAAACYERALALRPGLAQAHINLGIVLRQQNRLDEAAAHYRQALTLKPDSAEAHNNLGIILWQQTRFDEALTHYHQALAVRPDYTEALHNLGITLLVQGKPDEARQVFERLKSIDRDSPVADMDLSVCYLLDGDYGGAGGLTKRGCGCRCTQAFRAAALAGRAARGPQADLGHRAGVRRHAPIPPLCPAVQAGRVPVLLAVRPALGRLLSSLPRYG